MKIPNQFVHSIYINQNAVHEPLTERVRKNAEGIPVQIINDTHAASLFSRFSPGEGKRILYLKAYQGEMVKPCPATASPYLCCRYTVMHQVAQCPMDCVYCILQSYLDSPVVTVHANVQAAFDGVDRLLSEQPERLFRFGTGELGDSLALDEITGLSESTGKFFSTKRNVVIEFKTKTDRIERMIGRQFKNTIVSWSLNPQTVVNENEFSTASLSARLEAARRCQEAGYKVGFHFDPILYFNGWEKSYQEVVRQIFLKVDGSRIAWISLGTLRFPPPLKEIIQKRFPENGMVHEEMIRGLDGKMRYPRPRRIELTRFIYDLIKEKQPDLFVYFCMEHPSVWDAVTGGHPVSNAELDFQFAQSLYRRFPDMEISKPKREIYKRTLG